MNVNNCMYSTLFFSIFLIYPRVLGSGGGVGRGREGLCV